MSATFSVGELSNQLGINKETVRYYEKIGLLTEPSRDTNGYRTYTNRDIEVIRCIQMAKDFGFTLKEIGTLLHDEILSGDIESIKRLVSTKITDIDLKISELENTKRVLEKVQSVLLSKSINKCEDIQKI